MDKHAYLDGYLYKEADDKNVPRGTRYQSVPLPVRTPLSGLRVRRPIAHAHPQHILPRKELRQGGHEGMYTDPGGKLEKTYRQLTRDESGTEVLQKDPDAYFPRVRSTVGRFRSKPIDPEHITDLRKALYPTTVSEVAKGGAVTTSYNKGLITKQHVKIPKAGSRGYPTIFHEYAHAVDPETSWPYAAQRYEAELPAMVMDQSTAASPHYAEKGRPLTTMYEKQIEKFGPNLTGVFPKDLKNVKEWMRALRRVRGAELPEKEPFAYGPNKDPRTGEQRAISLGKAYERWMNHEVEKEK